MREQIGFAGEQSGKQSVAASTARRPRNHQCRASSEAMSS
jgi:hypothetical protein